MRPDPELILIRDSAIDFAVSQLRSSDKISDPNFRSLFVATVLSIPSKVAEASLHINVMERCKMLEHVRAACSVAETQATIGHRSQVLTTEQFEAVQTAARSIDESLHTHIRRIRGEFQDRRGKTAPFL